MSCQGITRIRIKGKYSDSLETIGETGSEFCLVIKK